jgi:hypothetical protein
VLVVPHEPPEVVNIRVAVPVNPAGGVQVVVFGVLPELFVKVPPEAVDQTAAVALPPNEPPNAVVVPPWQIAGKTVPAFAIGDVFTVIVAVLNTEIVNYNFLLLD